MSSDAGSRQECSSRRDAVATAAAAVASLWLSAGDAQANGLRDFLQSRQRIYALAPIYSSRQRLADTLQTLGEAQDMAAMRQALQAVRTASMNCYLFEVGAPRIMLQSCAALCPRAVTLVLTCTVLGHACSASPLHDPQPSETSCKHLMAWPNEG